MEFSEFARIPHVLDAVRAGKDTDALRDRDRGNGDGEGKQEHERPDLSSSIFELSLDKLRGAFDQFLLASKRPWPAFCRGVSHGLSAAVAVATA